MPRRLLACREPSRFDEVASCFASRQAGLSPDLSRSLARTNTEPPGEVTHSPSLPCSEPAGPSPGRAGTKPTRGAGLRRGQNSGPEGPFDVATHSFPAGGRNATQRGAALPRSHTHPPTHPSTRPPSTTAAAAPTLPPSPDRPCTGKAGRLSLTHRLRRSPEAPRSRSPRGGRPAGWLAGRPA